MSDSNPMGKRSPQTTDDGSTDDRLQDKIGLCLSGGGYRAMVFHLGALWRLHETGMLARVERVSSVSGGSITAAVLGLNWHDVTGGTDRARFERHLVEPVRRMARDTIDRGAILGGVLWFGSVSDRVANAYREALFGDRTLQDLPDAPRFVFNATNVQSGMLWRFSKPYMGDYRVGLVHAPTTDLGTVVAASSAFPPVLSPARLELDHDRFTPGTGTDLQEPPYTEEVVLSDGGVYDNLGLETVWKRCKTVLVSDGGGQMRPDPHPDSNWAGHSIRILDVIDNQVRSLRKRQLIASYRARERHGTYWGIRTDIADYELDDALPYPVVDSLALANIKTRLKAMGDEQQERLINWGYAVCDAGLRRHVEPNLTPRPAFPYPQHAP